MSFHSNDEVALEHMEFSYVKECKDTKELERILRKLKSGSEGYFPHLTTYCEERLAELNPKSKLLIKDGLPASKYDVDKKEWDDLKKEMNEFENIGKDNAGKADYNNVNLPPIRNNTVITTDGKKLTSKNEEWGKPSKDRISSSNYGAWDKFDADSAASNVDKDSSAESNTSNVTTEDTNIQNVVDTTGMSEEEKVVKANREKDKGNEAFHSKDFQEALAYYSRSISIQPSLAAYNNRALASIKLEKFDSAVKDCDKVLEEEPDNVKALLRRATAKKGLKNYHAAKLDVQQTLSLEPGNKQAKSMLAEIVTADSKNRKTESKGKRIEIEEVDGSDEEDDDEGSTENIANGCDKKMEKEVDETDGNICSSKKNVDSDQEPEEIPMDQDTSSLEQRSEVESKKANSSETISEQRPLATEQSEPAQAPVAAPPPPPSLPSTTLSYKDQAQKVYLAGQYDRASELYSKAIQTLMPDKDIHAVSLATLYSNRAACHSQTGDMRQCIQDCDDALKFGPFLIKPYLRRAKAYETLERYRQAYVDYRNVFRIDPTNKAAQDGSARCMMVLKEQDGSNWREKLPKPDVQPPTLIPPIFTTVAKSTSAATTATSTTVKMSTGLGSSDQKLSASQSDVKVEEKVDVEEDHQNEAGGDVEIAAQSENEANMAAEETLTKMESEETITNEDNDNGLEDKDDNVPTIQEQFQAAKDKGNMYHKKGEYSLAIKCYSECVDLDNTQTVGYTNRAHCHIKINQPLLAESDCSTALKLDDTNVKALYRRAQSRTMLKEYKLALVDLRTLLNIQPTNKAAAKDLETVKELYLDELRVKQMEAAPSTPPQATPKTQATASSTTPVKPTASPSTEMSEVSAKKKKKNNRKKIQIKEVEGSDDDEESKKETKSEPQEVTTTEDVTTTEQVEEVEVSKCEEVEEAEKMETAETEVPKEITSNVKPNAPPKNEGKRKKKKKSNNKGANSQIAVDTPPVDLKAGTPFEFTQSWTSIHNRPDCIQRLADLLLLVQPSKLPQIVSHSLDGMLLTALVQSLNTVIVKNDVDMALKVLQYLPKVQRFTTVMMFLSSADKTALQQVFHSLSVAESSKFSKRDVEQLKRKHYAAL